MIPGEAVLDAFIDANILFVVAYALWSVTRFLLRRLGVRHAYSTELGLLNAVFLAIVCSPFLIMAVEALRGTGVVREINLNLADMVVSHYLNGGFDMKASELERLLLVRDTFTLNVVNQAGWVAWLAIGGFVCGLLLGAARLAVSVWCLHRILAESYAWRGIGRVRIRFSDRTLVPFSTRGLRYYSVVIPSVMLGRRV